MKPHFKPILPEEEIQFKAKLQENKKDFDYPSHYHPEYELPCILSGHGMRYVGNSIEHFEANDLVLVRSNLPHCWINSEDHKQTESTVIVVYLKKEFIGSEWMNTKEFTPI